MYLFLSLLTGALVAVMLVVNGKLTAVTGVYLGTVIIHIVGLLLMLLLTALRRGFHKPKKGVPVWQYLGGCLGVGTVTLVNLAFGQISVTAMVALSLFAETLMSIFVDRYGWFGAEKHPFAKGGIWGLLVVGGGILVMLLPLGNASLIAVCFAMLSGCTNLFSRTINTGLASRYDSFYSTLWNYITGLTTAIVVWLLMGGSVPAAGLPTTAWFYLGGAMGICVVTLSIVCLKRVSSFYVTLFTFTGQVFTSIALDAWLQGSFSLRTFLGGLLVLAGLILNLLAERRQAA